MDVVGIGDLVLDFSLAVTQLPPRDGFSPLLDSSWQGGGKVPTAMVAASRLGAKTAIVATVGDDRYGRVVMRDFEANGVDTGHMVVEPNTATGLCVCIAEQLSQTRCYIGRLGQTGAVTPQQLDEAFVGSARYLHLWKMDDTARLAAEWVHRAGGTVVMDADRFSEDIATGLDAVDVLICSEFFYEGLYGPVEEERLESCLAALQARGPMTAIVTLGGRGCAGVGPEGFFRLPAFTGLDIRDTTGAGDVFHGAYIAALVRGLAGADAARYASAAAGIKCTQLGGRAGIPDHETVVRFLQTGVVDTSLSIDKWVAFYADNCL